jgi:antibiotic biosynthesis monooxygenase (ABM) superfamily enzyme
VIIPSRPSPWVRPGWYVALCTTDGLNQPQAWKDERQREAWVQAHARTFPEHEIHQAHGVPA